MKHYKPDCKTGDLILAGRCGLVCVNCFSCKCGTCKKNEEANEAHDIAFRGVNADER